MNKWYLLFALILFSGASYLPLDTRTKIAVLDGGIKLDKFNERYLCKHGHKDFTGTGIIDRDGHGTNIVGVIRKYIDPEKECILVIKYYDERLTGYITLKKEVLAINYAVSSGAKYINISGGGLDPHSPEELALLEAVDKKITVVVAAGNGSKNMNKICDFFPACYNIKSNYFHVVANLDGPFLAPSSNHNGPVTDYAQGTSVEGNGIVMTGTSQAAANITGQLISKSHVKENLW